MCTFTRNIFDYRPENIHMGELPSYVTFYKDLEFDKALSEFRKALSKNAQLGFEVYIWQGDTKLLRYQSNCPMFCFHKLRNTELVTSCSSCILKMCYLLL